MPRLFGTAGIRGPYPNKVNVDLALRLGAAVAVYGEGDVCVGFDVRVTSPLLAYGVCVGAMMAGVNAFNIGLAPTPTVAYSTVRLRCGGGVSVTASHNPPSDNGFKVFDSRGMESTRVMEDELERIMGEVDFRGGVVSWVRNGTRKQVDARRRQVTTVNNSEPTTIPFGLWARSSYCTADHIPNHNTVYALLAVDYFGAQSSMDTGPRVMSRIGAGILT